MLSILGTVLTVEKLIDKLEEQGFICAFGTDRIDIINTYNSQFDDCMIYPTLDFTKKVEQGTVVACIDFDVVAERGLYGCTITSKVHIKGIECKIEGEIPTFEPVFDDIPF